MNFLGSTHDFKKDLDHIQTLSEKIEKKLSLSHIPDDDKIEKLTLQELQDIHKLAELANFILYKYEDKKETFTILKRFVSIITESAKSIENLDDEISGLILTAEDSINKVKNMNSKISETSNFDKSDMCEIIEKSTKPC